MDFLQEKKRRWGEKAQISCFVGKEKIPAEKTTGMRLQKNAFIADDKGETIPPSGQQPSYNLHRISRWVVSNMLRCFQRPTADGSREACRSHIDPTSPITKCEDKQTAARRTGSAAPLRLLYQTPRKKKRGFRREAQEFSSSSSRSCWVKRSKTSFSSSSVSGVARNSSPFSMTDLRITRPKSCAFSASSSVSAVGKKAM